MRWHPATLVLLICALSKWLLATDIQIQDPSLAGMPLSDAEYDHFFKTLNSPGRVSAVCFLRTMYGCQNALVQTLDLYENHGIVPEGRVCSNLPEMPSFPDFCTLTFYRCSLKKYFVKRIHCPDEISGTSSATQNTNQELEKTGSSSSLQEAPLTSTLPTTRHTTVTSTPLTSVSNTHTAASETIVTVGTIPKHPVIISDTTSRQPLLDLTTSYNPVTTDSESLLELLTGLDAVIAGQSFPELFTTTLNNAEGSFSQHLMPGEPSLIRVPSTSNAMTATPGTSVSVVIETSTEPTILEATTSSVGSLPTHPASSPTSASSTPIVTVTETITPSVGSVPIHPATSIATASSPTSASPSPIVTVTVPATETTTPSVGSVPTNPATTVAIASSPTSASPSPVVTIAATEATTPSMGTVPKHPATTVALTSSPTSEYPSPIVPITATEATTPSVGSVPTNPAITVATASSPTSASPSPVVTIAATEATTPSVGSVPTNPAITVATASSPTSASPSPVVTIAATEATAPSVGSVPTNPATTVALSSSPTSASPSPVVTITATEATTPSVGTVPTNPATTVAPTSSPTSQSPSPIVTVTPTETTTASVGTVATYPATISSPTPASPGPIVIVTAIATPTTSCSSSPSPSSSTASKPASPKPPAPVLPPARVAGWPVVPISALLGQYPLQPTSVVQLLLLSPGFGPRKLKLPGIAVSSLLPFGAGLAKIRQRKIKPKPPMTTAKRETVLQAKLSTAERSEGSLPSSSPPAAELESFLTQLKDKKVQQLLQKMRDLMAEGKSLRNPQLQSTSLQLLAALKNANRKSAASLLPKKRLRR